eukprot:7291446-Ditylum_brightwellii.AAC.1
MEGVLQVLGFGSRVIDEEKAEELQHSTAKEDGNVTTATMTITDSSGPVDNSQEISVGDGAGNPLKMREIGQMDHLMILSP